MSDKIEALERLAKLRSDGVLNQDEYDAQKAALFSGQVPASSPRPAMTWAERWREGRERSRGIRRFFLWFYGIVGLIGLFIGIYYLARGHSLAIARGAPANSSASSADGNSTLPSETPEQAAADNAADDLRVNPAANPVSQTASIGNRSWPTIEISDDTIRAENKPDGSWNEINSGTVCFGQPLLIHNGSSRELRLSVAHEEGGDPAEPFGTLGRNQVAGLTLKSAKRYIISNAETSDAGAAPIELYRITVAKCANQ